MDRGVYRAKLSPREKLLEAQRLVRDCIDQLECCDARAEAEVANQRLTTASRSELIERAKQAVSKGPSEQ